MGNSPTCVPHVRVTQNTDPFAVATNHRGIVKPISRELLPPAARNINIVRHSFRVRNVQTHCLPLMDGRAKATVAAKL